MDSSISRFDGCAGFSAVAERGRALEVKEEEEEEWRETTTWQASEKFLQFEYYSTTIE